MANHAGPSRAAPIVALEGASGSGKSAVSAELARILGGLRLEEAFERIEPRPSLLFRDVEELRRLERSLWAAETDRWREAESMRGQGRRILLDTGPWGPLTYSWGLRESVASQWDIMGALLETCRADALRSAFPVPELTVYLDVPEELAAARAAQDPGGHPAELRERHRRVGRFERILYEQTFPELLPGRFLLIAGDRGPREVARSLADRLERMGPLPPVTPAESDRILDVFSGAVAPGPTAPTTILRSPKR